VELPTERPRRHSRRDGSLVRDEVLVCERDLIGKTREELRSLRFRRDRDWLQS
jgi:hypothetical protein